MFRFLNRKMEAQSSMGNGASKMGFSEITYDFFLEDT